MVAKKKNIIDIVLNFIIVITTIIAVGMYFNGVPDILGSTGVQCFKYFTTDSNVIACLGSLIYLFFLFKEKKKPNYIMPNWVNIFKFATTVAASITLFTVLFFLAPYGAIRGNGLATYYLFFKGNVFVLHFSTPLLAIISTMFLEKNRIVTFKQSLWGVIPTVIYSFVYLTMVVFVEKWTDWYGFTFGGNYKIIPIVMIVMYLFTFAFSSIEWKIKNKKH